MRCPFPGMDPFLERSEIWPDFHDSLITYIREVRRPSQCELYVFPIDQRLPRVAVPLAHDDPDVVLDLQAAFTRCWEAGPYPELLRYNDAPPGDLSADYTAWCRKRLVDAKLIEP